MVIRRGYYIIALLLISLSAAGQGPFLGVAASSNESQGSTTGESVLIYYEDFDNRPADASLTQAEMTTIFGSSTDPRDGQSAIWNVNGDGKERIFDDGGGDMVLLTYYDYPCTGSQCGMSIAKDLKAVNGADAILDGHIDLWMSWSTYYEAALDEQSSVKTWGGFIVGDWIWSYNPTPPDTWPELQQGLNMRMTMNTDENMRLQNYWYGMPTQYGQSFNWDGSYQGGGSIPMPTTLTNFALHLHLNEHPPDSVTGYFEMYHEEVLVARYDTMAFRMNDSLIIGWMLLGNFPGQSDPTDNDWWSVVDNIAMWYNVPGDSVWTGMEWLQHQDSIFEMDSPGWPPGEDTANWGKFSMLPVDDEFYPSYLTQQTKSGPVDLPCKTRSSYYRRETGRRIMV